MMKYLLPTVILAGVLQLTYLAYRIVDFNQMINRGLACQVDPSTLPFFTFNEVQNGFICGMTILMVAFIFVIYSFMTWYQEWYGKGNFIYRLLMSLMLRIQIFGRRRSPLFWPACLLLLSNLPCLFSVIISQKHSSIQNITSIQVFICGQILFLLLPIALVPAEYVSHLSPL